MPVTNYYTIEGSIIAEATSGVRTDYLTDALGSVTATVDSTGSILNTYRYKPYGDQLAKTGTAADPKFTWVGSLGYRQTGKKHSDTYVRARHYSSSVGRWTTKDPIRYTDAIPNLYGYALSNPNTYVDPDGNQAQKKQNPGKKPGLPDKMKQECLTQQAQNILLKKLNDSTCAAAIKKACKAGGLAAINDPVTIGKYPDGKPAWLFPEDCGPTFPGGRCISAVDQGSNLKLDEGDKCKNRAICITQMACKSGPNSSACLVIWELGNACECRYKGWRKGEDTAAMLRDACGCKGYVFPGGVVVHPPGTTPK